MKLTYSNNRLNPGKARSFFNEVKKNKALFLMLIPGLLVILVNNYLPMPGLLLAFKDFNYGKGFWNSDWIGFDNFQYLFSSKQAFIITRNTILYNLAFIIIAITVALALAILLSEIRNKRLAKFYQTIFFLPYFLSWVVISYLVFSLLSADRGIINNILGAFGSEPVSWYTEPNRWPVIIILVNTWKWTGYDSIIYLAAIVSIDKSYYEAAAINGASKLQQIRYITIPTISPVIIILTLLKIGRMFYCDFGLFWNIPRNMGILYNVTNVIDTYVYRSLIQSGDIGMAAASGLYQAVIGFVLVLISNLIVRRVNPDNALL